MNKLDQHFKTTLEGHTATPSSNVWEKVNIGLSEKPARSPWRIIRNLAPYAAVASVVLAIALFYPSTRTIEVSPGQNIALPETPTPIKVIQPTEDVPVDLDLAASDFPTPTPSPKKIRREVESVLELPLHSPKQIATNSSFESVQPMLVYGKATSIQYTEPSFALAENAGDALGNWLGKRARTLSENTTEVVAIGVVNWEKTKHTLNQKIATLTP